MRGIMYVTHALMIYTMEHKCLQPVCAIYGADKTTPPAKLHRVRLLNLKMSSNLCQRSFDQTPQQGMSRHQRLAKMKGGFNTRQTSIYQNINRIAIVDHVMTTGAPAKALSSSLINALDRTLNIQIWCVARAQPPNILLDW